MAQEKERDEVIIETIGVSLADDSHLFFSQAIKYKGIVWLAPKWKITSDEKYVSPEWIIPITQFPHQDMGSPTAFGRYAINVPLPKILFEGPILPETQKKYSVVMEPPLRAERPRIQ